LVQANYGRRELLRIDGIPVGAAIPTSEVPSPWDELQRLRERRRSTEPPAPAAGPTLRRGSADGGSIIVLVATDAPLLPHQCQRLAQRPSLGLGRMGSFASHGSGDLFLAWSTANRDLGWPEDQAGAGLTTEVRAVVGAAIDPLFEAAAEATEEAVVNALVAAETMTGRDGITAYAIDHERLRALLGRARLA
ncbi:MAG TPA: P1 family peptidase, partial [Candidatus Limnocylindrales bacterium]|nr:P1 family peptidase [Candidatus Limnocylindrales bacterium]